MTTQAACAAPSAWQGAGTDCTPNPCPAPTITLSPTTLSNGSIGVAYSRTITASGGTGPYSFDLSAGALPDGLSLASGGALTGTPTTNGSSNFTVRATDANSFTGTRAYTLTISASTLDLTVSKVYITQATQTQAFDVPLLQDRNGLLRAFVIASESNSATPQVRVRIYNASDVLTQTYTISAPGASVPTAINEGTLTSTWNQLIPGSLLQEGSSILVDVDPTDVVSESNDSNNSWPSSGTPHNLDVRVLPELEMTLVPVTNSVGTGGVNSGNASSYMDQTRRMQPIPDYDVAVRAAMSTSTVLESDGDGWETVLNEVTAQRTTDGSSRHYYGVVKVNYGSGVAGLGWIGYPVAIGWDYLPSASEVMAHEIGHNWDYGHTACTGTEGGPEPLYPHAGGKIGAYGYDLWSSAQLNKDTYKDLMSYCSPVWISDYTYKRVLTYRQSDPTRPEFGVQGGASRQSCLLVWGVRRHGEIRLEPSFLIETKPTRPKPGSHRVEGVDASGEVIWSQSFELMRTTHLPDETAAGFCFAVPMREELLDRIATLRVVSGGTVLAQRQAASDAGARAFRAAQAQASITAAGGSAYRLTWNAALSPVVMVRDRDEGTCLGFARDGSASISSPSGRLELYFSDGVHTRVQTWSPR